MTEPSRPALLVTGATGLVGAALARRRPIVPLPRRAPPGGGPWWSPEAGEVHDAPPLVGAVVHLAGAPVAERRWTEVHKRDIYDSRVQGTRALVDWMARRPQRPAVLVCASAVGLYGDRGDTPLPEEAERGSGFLADVVAAWEAEADRAHAELGVRVVKLRIGVALSPAGGALAQLLPTARLGLGGPLGSGQQWFPWVHLDDVVGAVEWALTTEAASGPYNVVAPGIVRQKELARTLGRVLHRPARLPVPRLALRAALGEMAEEAVLSSAQVVPRRLLEAGFRFQYPDLEPALAALLR